MPTLPIASASFGAEATCRTFSGHGEAQRSSGPPPWITGESRALGMNNTTTSTTSTTHNQRAAAGSSLPIGYERNR